MTGNLRFAAFIVVALVVFVVILRVVLRARSRRPSWMRVLTTAFIVVVSGMLFAKIGQNSGLPWWIYYTVPMVVTVVVPPVVFCMNRRETPAYLVLAFLSSLVIHVVFSFFLGWKDYTPFIAIPAMWAL